MRTMTMAQMSRVAFASIFGLVFGAQVLAAQSASSDPLGRALRDELRRSMEQLRLEQLERPYFIAYHVTETRSLMSMARYGSLSMSEEERGRALSVELRVGDYAFDNSGFLGMPSMGFRGMFDYTELPLDDDYSIIRRTIWLATDAAYKRAIEAIASKRSARLNRPSGDSLPDFSKAPATQTVDEDPVRPATLADMESLVRDVSAIPELKRLPSSSVSGTLSETRQRYVTSEGTTYSRTRATLTLYLNATAQASDGAEVHASVVTLGAGYDPASTRQEAMRRMRALALGLDSLRVATASERYSGPVLFEGLASAQLFADVLAPALVGARRSGQATFADKLGARVLPEWMSVIDDPTITEYQGHPLLGHFKVDDEGVTGRSKQVVVGGYLKTLLTTRTPVEGVDGSTGNARGRGAGPSNLIVSVDSGASDDALRMRFLSMIERRKLPYGIVVREIEGGELGAMMQLMFDGDVESIMSREFGRGTGYDAALLAAYRVYPDGHEERIRGARLTNFTVESFRDVIAASSTQTVMHAPAAGERMGLMMGGGEAAPASYVVPSLLFEDVAISKQNGARATPPISAPPPGN
jgi:microcin-processing metallopeptidase PmbA/TldD-like protein